MSFSPVMDYGAQAPGAQGSGPFAEEHMGLADLMLVLRRRRLVFWSVFALGVVLVMLVAGALRATYSAEAVVRVQGRDPVEDISPLTASESLAEELKIETVIEELSSRTVARALASEAIDDPDLTVPEMPGLFGVIRQVLRPVLGGAEAAPSGPEDEARAAELNRLTVQVLGATSVDRLSGSRLIGVEAQGETPLQAAVLANALVQTYLNLERTAVERAQSERLARLEQQAQALQAELYDAELATAAYMRDNDLVSPQQGGTVEARMAALERALGTARAEGASRELDRLREQEAALAERLSTLTVTYGTGYPEVVALTDQLARLRGRIAEESASVERELLDSRAAIDASAAALSEELSSVRSRHFAALEANAGLRELERAAARKLDAYNAVEDRLTRTRALTERIPDSISYVTEASVPAATEHSETAKVLAVGSLGAFALAVLAALTAETLDGRIRSAAEVRGLLDAPTLSLLPRMKDRSLTQDTIGDFLRSHRDSHYALAVRDLFLELSTAQRTRELRTVVVTTLLPGQGAGTLAAALATTAELLGYRTVVLSMDSKGELSFSEGWRARGAAGSAEHPAGAEGEALAQSEASALSHRMPHDLARMSEDWDLIVVEAPPVFVSRDAKALAPFADEVVLGIPWGKMKPRALRTARHLFGRVPLSAVITDVNVRQHARGRYGDAMEFVA